MKPETIWVLVKSIILGISLIIFSFGSYTAIAKIVEHFDLKNNLIKEEMIALSNNMASQRVEFDSKKLEDRISDLDKVLTDLAKSRNQEINQFGKIISSLQSTINEMKSDKYVDPNDTQKTFDQTLVYTKDSEGNDFPLAHVLYNPFLDNKNKWTTRAYPIKFFTEIALGENKDRSDAYVKLWMENDDIEEYKGKKFPLQIDNVDWIKRPPKNKRFMLNPRLSLGSSFDTNAISPNLGISTFSFGRTNRDMDWTFLRFGVGGNKESFILQLSPIEYNVGNHIPLIENLFCGPSFGYDLSTKENETEFVYGLSVDIPF